MKALESNKKPRPLTEKQRRFTEAYMGQARGNATEAARLAGYCGNDNTLASVGDENLRKPAIWEAIAERVAADPAVLTREQLQQFWSNTVKDETQKMTDRLQASALLAKSRGEFVHKIEAAIDGDSIWDTVREIKESEAEYERQTKGKGRRKKAR